MSLIKLQTPVGSEDHVQGNKHAPLTLVEYGDYQCPYCGMADPIVKRLQKHFGHELRFVFRNFPLTQSHQYALTAAMAAEAAALQDKFWEMHDKLFENQERLKAEDLLQYARDLGLDIEKFNQAMQSKDLLNRIRADYLSGEMSGVDGTPSFYINGVKFVGPLKYDEIKNFIEDFIDHSGPALHT